MPNLFLALPTQSVAVRLLVGAVVAGIVVRLLLRSGLRVPRLRVAASQLPALVLVAIGLVSVGAMRLPSFVRPFDGDVTFATSYEVLAPVALPALLGTWFVVFTGRVGWRLWSLRRLRTAADAALADTPVPARVLRIATRLASDMDIDMPPVGISSDLAGGASVIGLRRPVVLVDGELAARLDDEELQGVLAHEFAHVRRRDNLVAFALCLVGDATFFVPGGRWSRRQLLVERELATDEDAVAITGRPGALASGLLKVVESATAQPACAAFMPQGTLVERIEHLVDTRPAPGRGRLLVESFAVGSALAACVLAATGIPRVVAGDQPESGLGLAIGGAEDASPTTDAGVVATPDAIDDGLVFEVYDLTNLSSTAPDLSDRGPVVDDGADLVRPDLLRACGTDAGGCLPAADTAPLPLRPLVEVEPSEELVRWRVQPVVETSDVIRIYYLSRTS